MKRISFFGILALFLVSLMTGCNTAKKEEDSGEIAEEKNEENFGTRDGEKDADFVVKAVEGNYAEIKLAQLGMNKSTDTGLKDIAMMLEKDHTKVLNELKDFAYKKGIAIPTEENKDAKDDLVDLEKKDLAEFNKDWLSMLTDKHENTIKNFETIQEKTEDTELKSWAIATLPTLRTHLDKLKTYKDVLK